MDMIFILEHTVCCYRYSPNLRARAYFINDHRLLPDKWTPKDSDRFRKALPPEENNVTGNKNRFTGLFTRALHEHIVKSKEQGKSLIVIDYSSAVLLAIEELLKEAKKRDEYEQWLLISFFHSDEVMQDLQYSSKPEELIKDKIFWIEEMVHYPLIKTFEIPYNKTLHEDYLRELFEETFHL